MAVATVKTTDGTYTKTFERVGEAMKWMREMDATEGTIKVNGKVYYKF